MEYRPVRVRGKFLHERELIMGPRSLITPNDEHKGGLLTQQDSSMGYLVITPFQIENRRYTRTNNLCCINRPITLFFSEIILINRGWVPKNFIDPNSRLEGQIKDSIEIIGVVRKTESRPQFAPKQSGRILMYRLVKQLEMLFNGSDFF